MAHIVITPVGNFVNGAFYALADQEFHAQIFDDADQLLTPPVGNVVFNWTTRMFAVPVPATFHAGTSTFRFGPMPVSSSVGPCTMQVVCSDPSCSETLEYLVSAIPV